MTPETAGAAGGQRPQKPDVKSYVAPQSALRAIPAEGPSRFARMLRGGVRSCMRIAPWTAWALWCLLIGFTMAVAWMFRHVAPILHWLVQGDGAARYLHQGGRILGHVLVWTVCSLCMLLVFPLRGINSLVCYAYRSRSQARDIGKKSAYSPIS